MGLSLHVLCVFCLVETFFFFFFPKVDVVIGF